MKRYRFVLVPEAWGNETDLLPDDDGEWVLYTDAQAEIAKLREGLRRALWWADAIVAGRVREIPKSDLSVLRDLLGEEMTDG